MLFRLLLVVLCSVSTVPALAQSTTVILSTTTSTEDSGLLDTLVPMFEKKTGMTVKTISVGTGQALALAARGEADVALVHAPSLERKYVEEGKMQNRRLVMYNDFVIIGPAADPAHIKGLKASDAMKAIGASGSRFVSRGDNSGTHVLEKSLWKLTGIEPKGEWYIESGQGMGATLQLADEKHGYTLTDRATYLTWRDKLQLFPMVEGDSLLYNVYHVLELNPKNASRINAVGGKALADFLVAPETQRLIGEYGKSRFGQSLFVPDAGKEPSR